MKSLTDIILRNWTEEDFQIVKDILLTTWKDTYSFIPDSDILEHFNDFYSNDRLIEMINDPFTKGIIAEVNLVPVGWMKLFENTIEKKIFISSLYVLPAYQGIGLGKTLLNKAYSIAIQKRFKKVWLGVMMQNVNALAWYQKIGFVFTEEEPFKMGKSEVIHLIGYKTL